ncbi:hypothetical protein ACIQUQ_02140 [Streptomyces sp. NPDC101118]|uniref:hypothetical protein n=1 Tax=Streptomyces sp. NPDC101118 TaxID=3366109 RepID=UPI0038091DDF
MEELAYVVGKVAKGVAELAYVVGDAFATGGGAPDSRAKSADEAEGKGEGEATGGSGH